MSVTTTNIGNLHFNYKGDYNAGTAYVIDDVVQRGNTDFVCVAPSTGNLPSIQREVDYIVTVAAGTTYPSGSGNTFFLAGQGMQNAAAITNPALTFKRGELHHFNQDDSTNDGHPMLFGTNGNTSVVDYAKGVRYYLDGRLKSQAQYENVTNFNAATTRRIEISVHDTAPVGGTPADLWYHCGVHGVGMGNEITVTNATMYWRPVRESLDWKGAHVNTNGTQYYINDVVHIDVPYDNTLGGSQFAGGDATGGTGFLMHDQVRTTKANYICVQEHQADGTNTTLPWNNNANWDLVSSDEDFDDSVIAANKAQGQIATFTGDYIEAIEQPMHETVLGMDNPTRRLGNNYQKYEAHNFPTYLGGRGNIMVQGSSSTGQNAHNQTMMTMTNVNFPFLDWYRSTDHGGTGVHNTPDGKAPKVIKYQVGYETGLVLMNNGEVYHWGYGGHGQSGDASNSTRSFPQRVGGTYQEIYDATNTSTHVWRDLRMSDIHLSNWSCQGDSTHHCGAIDENGDVWMWGYNGYGQLGIGSTSNQNRPQKINNAFFNLQKIRDMWMCGGSYGSSYFYTAQGRIYSCGYNGYGQLGINSTSQATAPLLAIGENGSGAHLELGVGENIVKFWCDERGSYGRACCLTDAGKIYTTGYNARGWAMSGTTSQQNKFTQASLGYGSGTGSAVNFWLIGCGQYGSIYVKGDDGNMQACGSNQNYQLCNGSSSNTNAPVIPQFSIGGTNLGVSMKDVKGVWGMAGYDYHNVFILTNGGHMFVGGRNNRGSSSMGWSDSYANASQDRPNGIEDRSNGYAQMPRLMNDCQGHIRSIRPFGYTSNDASSHYWRCSIITDRNRFLHCGYEAYHMDGSMRNSRENVMSPPPIG